MNIKKLINESYKTAERKGFWKEYNSVLKKMDNGDYTDEEIESVKNAFINQKIMLIVSELGELMETLRKNKFIEVDDNILNELQEQYETNPDLFYMRFIHFQKDRFEDELADVMIRLGDLIGKLEIDIEKHIDLKQKFNSLRENKHGKNFKLNQKYT